MGCCGKGTRTRAAMSKHGPKVMVEVIGNPTLIAGSGFIKVVGTSTKLTYGYKNPKKPFCLFEVDADAEPQTYKVTGECK